MLADGQRLATSQQATSEEEKPQPPPDAEGPGRRAPASAGRHGPHARRPPGVRRRRSAGRAEASALRSEVQPALAVPEEREPAAPASLRSSQPSRASARWRKRHCASASRSMEPEGGLMRTLRLAALAALLAVPLAAAQPPAPVPARPTAQPAAAPPPAPIPEQLAHLNATLRRISPAPGAPARRPEARPPAPTGRDRQPPGDRPRAGARARPRAKSGAWKTGATGYSPRSRP